MTTPYTTAELSAEYDYRHTEFLGICIEDRDPTPEQNAAAALYARQVITLLRGTKGPMPKPGQQERDRVGRLLKTYLEQL